MILDKVLRFFIILFMAIAGGALLSLASPVLTPKSPTSLLTNRAGKSSVISSASLIALAISIL